MRWIPPESLHLTLVFLGSTEPERVAAITAALADVAAAAKPFDISLGGAGGRAGGRRGGVAWLRVEDGATELGRVAHELDGRLPALRAGAINPAHLTVARGVDEAALADLRASGAGSGLRWIVDRIVLFRSHTGPRGASYELVAQSPLED